MRARAPPCALSPQGREGAALARFSPRGPYPGARGKGREKEAEGGEEGKRDRRTECANQKKGLRIIEGAKASGRLRKRKVENGIVQAGAGERRGRLRRRNAGKAQVKRAWKKI